MTISEVMTKEVLAIQESTPVQTMLRLFARTEISGAPVIDHDGNLIGVVSLSDLARKRSRIFDSDKSFYLDIPIEPEEADKKEDTSLKVSDIMTHLIISAKASDPILRAADLMVNHDIHRVVVTDQDKVVGLITSGELIRVFRDRLLEEQQ